ncbi:hypothetical protein SXCC_03548 [Gluconacetobacter sp. SXCC-1]|nr:hypothetical protein SXCC_03548 [Gluconacetobacter sp. SXCC-1]
MAHAAPASEEWLYETAHSRLPGGTVVFHAMARIGVSGMPGPVLTAGVRTSSRVRPPVGS